MLDLVTNCCKLLNVSLSKSVARTGTFFHCSMAIISKHLMSQGAYFTQNLHCFGRVGYKNNVKTAK